MFSIGLADILTRLHIAPQGMQLDLPGRCSRLKFNTDEMSDETLPESSLANQTGSAVVLHRIIELGIYI
jgi:hypothetical protein